MPEQKNPSLASIEQGSSSSERAASSALQTDCSAAQSFAGWRDIASAPKDGTLIVGRIRDYSPLVLSWRAYTWGAPGEQRWRDCKGQIFRPFAWCALPALCDLSSEAPSPQPEAKPSAGNPVEAEPKNDPSPTLTREDLARIIYECICPTASGMIPFETLEMAEEAADLYRAADAILARLSPLPSPEKQQNQEHTVSVAESGGSPTTSVKSDSPHFAGGRDR